MSRDPFEDIITLPHPVSKRHPRMTIAQRAAQFAPFSAVSGYEEAIRETARRHTENKETSASDFSDQ